MKRSQPIIIVALILASVLVVGILVLLLTSSRKQTPSTSSTSQTSTTTSSSANNSYIATNQGLTSFPKAALGNPNITFLDISHNQITSLPSQIGQLTKLEDMNVSYNKLSGALPGEIRKMSLKNLDASHNLLTGIPAEIGQQPNLQTINFSYNQLTGLPNELANIPIISRLDLSYNNISSTTDLAKLTNVKLLKIGGNKLSPTQIAELQKLLPNTEVSQN